MKQDHFQYDEFTVLDTVIMGNQRLYDIMQGKGGPLCQGGVVRSGRHTGLPSWKTEFAELGGWEAETDASRILQGLGMPVSSVTTTGMADTWTAV